MKSFTSKNQKFGQVGENIACKYLKNKGFNIIERNFTHNRGEIDIVAKKGDQIRFVEVKTISRRYLKITKTGFTPEQKLNYKKMQKILITSKVYLYSKGIKLDSNWQIDLLAIEYYPAREIAHVRHHECIY